MKQAKIVILIASLALVAAACNKPTNNSGSNNNPSPTPAPATDNSSTSTNGSTVSDVLTGQVLVNYTTSGYNPSTLKVKKGTTVTFVNKSGSQMWPASAPHPTHTDYPELDPKKAVANDQTWAFTFDKVGTWKFHDHLFPSRFGSVTVVE